MRSGKTQQGPPAERPTTLAATGYPRQDLNLRTWFRNSRNACSGAILSTQNLGAAGPVVGLSDQGGACRSGMRSGRRSANHRAAHGLACCRLPASGPPCRPPAGAMALGALDMRAGRGPRRGPAEGQPAAWIKFEFTSSHSAAKTPAFTVLHEALNVTRAVDRLDHLFLCWMHEGSPRPTRQTQASVRPRGRQPSQARRRRKGALHDPLDRGRRGRNAPSE